MVLDGEDDGVGGAHEGVLRAGLNNIHVSDSFHFDTDPHIRELKLCLHEFSFILAEFLLPRSGSEKPLLKKYKINPIFIFAASNRFKFLGVIIFLEGHIFKGSYF